VPPPIFFPLLPESPMGLAWVLTSLLESCLFTLIFTSSHLLLALPHSLSFFVWAISLIMVSSRAFVALVTVARLMVEGLSPLWSGMAIVVLTLTSSSINIVAVLASDTINDTATQGGCTDPGTCSSTDDVDGAALPDDGFLGESLQDDE